MTALVTGASGGVGAAVARTLAVRGHDIAVHYRSDRPAAEATADDVRAAGRRAHLVAADLDVDDVDAAVTALLEDVRTHTLGPLDIAVLAASSQELTPWPALDTAAWDRLYRGTLRHTAALLHAVGGQMAAEGGGAVVLVGSVEALRAAPDHAPYAVFKAAVHHLASAAAQALGRKGVRVVGVVPGLVDRPGLARDWPDGLARWSAAAPLGRPVTADEVAQVVAFLTSPDASGVTGTTVVVDGGWSASPGW